MQQPLIAPLFWGVSAIEVLSRIVGNAAPNGHDEVKATLAGRGASSDAKWRRMVHSGIAATGKAVTPKYGWQGLTTALKTPEGPTKPSPGAMEIVFATDPSVFDGRFANNGWLQELPDPVTKVTWDNAAQVSVKTAKELSVTSGDMLKVTLDGASVQVPVFVTPGTADNVVILPTGYGRTVGTVASGAGFDVTPLRTTAAPHFAFGARVEAVGDKYLLASTQDHHTMVEPITGRKRPVVRETTLAEYRKDPNWVDKLEVMSKEKYPELKSLWEQPNKTDGLQWGMVIDLNSCTGYHLHDRSSENNIPIGKECRTRS